MIAAGDLAISFSGNRPETAGAEIETETCAARIVERRRELHVGSPSAGLRYSSKACWPLILTSAPHPDSRHYWRPIFSLLASSFGSSPFVGGKAVRSAATL